MLYEDLKESALFFYVIMLWMWECLWGDPLYEVFIYRLIGFSDFFLVTRVMHAISFYK